jgi:hypothetical protein
MAILYIKPGADVRFLCPEIASKAFNISAIYEFHGQAGAAFITSGNDSTHKTGSKHYQNRAIDLRTRGMAVEKVKAIHADLVKLYGRDFDVILEKDHIHLEYDPKGVANG